MELLRSIHSYRHLSVHQSNPTTPNALQVFHLSMDEPICQSACLSSKILHVKLYQDRKPHECQKLGGGPKVRNCLTPGPLGHKIC